MADEEPGTVIRELRAEVERLRAELTGYAPLDRLRSYENDCTMLREERKELIAERQQLRAKLAAAKAEPPRLTSTPLVTAVREILEGLDEIVRDGGGHYEEAAARRDAAMLREALAQVGQEEPPRPAAILLVYCDEEESFNWGSAHVHAFEKIHGPGGMLEFSREAGSSGDVYRVHNWTWHPKRAGD